VIAIFTQGWQMEFLYIKHKIVRRKNIFCFNKVIQLPIAAS